VVGTVTAKEVAPVGAAAAAGVAADAFGATGIGAEQIVVVIAAVTRVGVLQTVAIVVLRTGFERLETATSAH
jgi:hypothetical protein